MSKLFPHTEAALVVYDAEIDRLDKLDVWNSDGDYAEYCEGISAALTTLQRAFFEDTKHVNSIQHCLVTSVSYMRECVAKH